MKESAAMSGMRLCAVLLASGLGLGAALAQGPAPEATTPAPAAQPQPPAEQPQAPAPSSAAPAAEQPQAPASSSAAPAAKSDGKSLTITSGSTMTKWKWEQVKAKWRREKAKMADCRSQAREQKLRGPKSWHFIADCMIRVARPGPGEPDKSPH